MWGTAVSGWGKQGAGWGACGFNRGTFWIIRAPYSSRWGGWLAVRWQLLELGAVLNREAGLRVALI